MKPLLFKTRQAWRAWLSANHASQKEAWLLFYKRAAAGRALPYAHAVEEALCFGWIDSLLQRIDATRHQLRFTPRKERSTWSESNKQRVERLTRQGLMHAAGLRLVEAARRNGSWNRLSAVDNLEAPKELLCALRRDRTAGANYRQLPPSRKKQFIWWVASARKDDTRQKRVREAVKMISQKRVLGGPE